MSDRSLGKFGAARLPAETTSFVGRVSELAEMRRLLVSTRLVTLTGVGGVGKTRLALRVAAAVSAAFPDGVWLADLTLVDRKEVAEQPGLLARTVAEAVGFSIPTTDAMVDELAAHLQQRRLLLVLDGCEHVATEIGELMDRLLRMAPGLQVVATSRHWLRVAGERIVPVGPLPVVASEGAKGEAAAVELLADRVQDVVPGWTVTAANRRDVYALCRELGGNPLAIELAAARMAVMSARELLQRLADHQYQVLRRLGTGARASARDTLWSTVDWSYQLCSEAERTLWVRASVFAGWFDLAAVEAVCGVDADPAVPESTALDLVDSLVQKSVISVHAGDTTRYELTETIRSYGLHRLSESGDETATRERYVRYVMEVTGEAARDWCSPRDAWWLQRLHHELPNVRSAMDYCARTEKMATGLQIAVNFASARSCFFLGVLDECIYQLRRWLDVSPLPPVALRAKAAGLAAWLAISEGSPKAASFLSEAEALAEEVPGSIIPEVLFASAVHRWLTTGDLDAIAGLRRARAEYEVTDPFRVMCGLFVAVVAARSATEATARAAVAECRGEAALVGSPRHALWVDWAEAQVELRFGSLDRAETLVTTVLRDLGATGDLWDPLWAAVVAAEIATARKDYEAAAVRLGGVDRMQALSRSIEMHNLVPFAAALQQVRQSVETSLGTRAFRAAYRRTLPLTSVAEIAAQLSGDTTEPSRPVEGVPILSGREMEVAGWVAEGLSNREIADKLVIGVRTVESHVQNACSKLGVTNRSALASWYGAQAQQR